MNSPHLRGEFSFAQKYIFFSSENTIIRQLYKLFFVHPLTQGEGQVFGIGAKIFTIAGPVILYGIVTSWVLGVIYWITTMF